MAKGKRMTLKQAADFLSKTDYPFTVFALKRAAGKGALKAELIAAPLPYYLVAESDLLAWASDPTQHRAGRPAKGSK